MNASPAYYVPARLPPIAMPPHDPTSLLLNARVGWRWQDLQQLEIQPVNSCGEGGGLALAPWPGSARRLSEDSGSFGGLKLPGNVALGPAGDLYLLDRSQGVLKFFDRCDCVFKRIPCFGEAGPERMQTKDAPPAQPVDPACPVPEPFEQRWQKHWPRHLHQANGILICNGDLYICDTGNARVLQLSLHGYIVRRVLTPPASLVLTQAWAPYAIAMDGHGTLYISDQANGVIHRLKANGLWLTPITGVGGVSHLALDCDDRLYALLLQDKTRVVAILPNPLHTEEAQAAWLIQEIDSRADLVARRFAPPPLAVDTRGNLYLAPWCEQLPCDNPAAAFDLNGNPLPSNNAVAGPLYLGSGTYLSLALDSERYRCQWHRVVLHGQLPKGTRIQIDSFCSEVELDANELAQVPEQQWDTRVVLMEKPGQKKIAQQWDALIRSEPGRFMWLRLTLSGNGMATPLIEQMLIEYPRISLRRYLPAVYGAEPVSADFTDRLLALFDTSLRSIERQLDTQAGLFDPLSAPAEVNRDFLSWIASWVGITSDRHWPEEKRRQFVKQASKFFAWRGTRYGLRHLLLLLLDMQPEQVACSGRASKKRCVPLPANCGPEPALPPWQAPPLILEHYQLRRWLFVGSSTLGDDAVLWGKRIVNRSQLDSNAQLGESQLIMTPDPWRDPFHVDAHKFTVFVPSRIKGMDATRRALENLLKTETPAHTAYHIEYVEPRFRVGVQATIGLDAVVARMPSGVRLDDAYLRHGTVLSAAPHAKGGPEMAVGKNVRIGSNRLN